MSEITLDSVVCRSSDVMASSVENELVMMDIDRGMYYALNAVGSVIWERIAQPSKVADLCDQLQQVYAVDAATCEADVLAVLNDMAANGLLADPD
jgi:hypothetical protein